MPHQYGWRLSFSTSTSRTNEIKVKVDQRPHFIDGKWLSIRITSLADEEDTTRVLEFILKNYRKKANAKLVMLDGTGLIIEGWNLGGISLKDIEESSFELRYKTCEFESHADKPPAKLVPTPRVQKMGLGELVNQNITFARKFRWTLEGVDLPEIFVKKVNIDYIKKEVAFEYMDVIQDDNSGIHALVWAFKLEKDSNQALVFTTFDGCGNPLYECIFSFLHLLEHHSDFDYVSNETSTQIITVRYEIVTKRLIACTDKFKQKKPSVSAI